ncbi:hypothetical protein KVD69_00390 [Helicobacter pylori]|nr:hypothetical protein KVD69_00390 [Helicobacter pylori]
MRFLHDTPKSDKTPKPFLRQPPATAKNPSMFFQIFAPQKQRKSFHKR